MAGEGKRKNLGRGLSALLGEDTEDYAELDRVRGSKTVPVDQVHPGRYQPRHRTDDQQLADLARSIAEKGVLQPILVRRHPDETNAYEIIAGERRWRAAQMVPLHEVPVVIKDLSDQEALEIALIENLQREDLSPLEEAEGYRRLMEEFANNQEDLAKAVGKSRPHVANTMRLLDLPDPVKVLVEDRKLSAGHARALLSTADPVTLARQVVDRGLNVRQTERLVQASGAATKGRRKAEKDSDTLALEHDLTNLLGMPVEIRFRRRGGSLILHYGSLEQLDDILHRLSHGAHGTQGGAAPDMAAESSVADAGEPLDDAAAADAAADELAALGNEADQPADADEPPADPADAAIEELAAMSEEPEPPAEPDDDPRPPDE